MKLDLVKAFLTPFSDKGYPRKVLLLWLMFVMNAVYASQIRPSTEFVNISFFIISYIPSAIIHGYIIKTVHNEIKGNSPIMPEWTGNFYQYFLIGLKYIFINCLYFLPAMLLLSNAFAGVHAPDGFTTLTNQIILFVLIPLTALFALISPFVTMSYAENFRFLDGFMLKKICTEVFLNLKPYAQSGLVLIALKSLIVVLKTAFRGTLIGMIFISLFDLYISIVSLNLFAQIYRQRAAQVKAGEPAEATVAVKDELF